MKLCAFRQFVDGDGAPLAGGLIYTYITHTSTLKTTYTDSTGDSSLPNPVVLSSAGTKEIWLDTDTAYTFVIKDSAGSTISTIHDITPVTTLAASTGGANIDITGYAIITTSNGDLKLTPNGSGHVKISDAYKLPLVDGSSTQVLLSNGAGQCYWGSSSFSVLQDTAPTLGGNLNLNSKYIVDENSNKEFGFTATASAVNYLNVTNAATGSGPTLAAAGSDTNINLTFDAKGSGLIVASDQIKATAGITAPGTHTISDYSNTGTLASFIGVASEVNYPTTTTSITGNPVIFGAAGTDSNIGIKVTPKGSGIINLNGPTTINTFVHPTSDGAVGTYLGTDGSKNLTLRNPITDLGASKATMEAATSNTTLVTPARMLNHPGIPKAMFRLKLDNTNTISNNYGVTSVVYNSAADYTVTFSTAFADTNYSMVVGTECTGASVGFFAQCNMDTKTTTTCRVTTIREDGGGAAGGYVSFAFYGTQ